MRIARACVLGHVSHVQVFVTPWTIACQDSPGKNAGVGCCFLLQGIFLTRGSQVSAISCLGRQVVYHWRRLGSPEACRVRGESERADVLREVREPPLPARRPRLCCASALPLALATAACVLRLAFLVSMQWFTSHVYLLVCPFLPVLGLPRSAGFSWFAVSPQSSHRSGSPGRSAQALEVGGGRARV